MLYEIVGQDNDTFAFDGRDDVKRCPECRALLNKFEESLEGIRIRRLRKKDVSQICDGLCVVSEHFREVCESAGLRHAKFRQFPDDPMFYAFLPDCVVKYDQGTTGYKAIDPCPVCSVHCHVCPGEYRLLPGEIVPDDGFARTDILFAGGGPKDGMGYDERFPLIFVGEKAMQELKDAGVTGIDAYRKL